jgi:hypothetical protein
MKSKEADLHIQFPKPRTHLYAMDDGVRAVSDTAHFALRKQFERQ